MAERKEFYPNMERDRAVARAFRRHGIPVRVARDGGYGGVTRYILNAFNPFLRLEIVDDGYGREWEIRTNLIWKHRRVQRVMEIFREAIGWKEPARRV